MNYIYSAKKIYSSLISSKKNMSQMATGLMMLFLLMIRYFMNSHLIGMEKEGLRGRMECQLGKKIHPSITNS